MLSTKIESGTSCASIHRRPERREHRHAADRERDPGRHRRPERQREHEQRRRDADRLGPAQVGGGGELDVLEHRRRPGHVDREARRRAQRGPEPLARRCGPCRGRRAAGRPRRPPGPRARAHDHGPRRRQRRRAGNGAAARSCGAGRRRRRGARPPASSDWGRRGSQRWSMFPARTASESWAMNPPDARAPCSCGASGASIATATSHSATTSRRRRYTQRPREAKRVPAPPHRIRGPAPGHAPNRGIVTAPDADADNSLDMRWLALLTLLFSLLASGGPSRPARRPAAQRTSPGCATGRRSPGPAPRTVPRADRGREARLDARRRRRRSRSPASARRRLTLDLHGDLASGTTYSVTLSYDDGGTPATLKTTWRTLPAARPPRAARRVHHRHPARRGARHRPPDGRREPLRRAPPVRLHRRLDPHADRQAVHRGAARPPVGAGRDRPRRCCGRLGLDSALRGTATRATASSSAGRRTGWPGPRGVDDAERGRRADDQVRVQVGDVHLRRRLPRPGLDRPPPARARVGAATLPDPRAAAGSPSSAPDRASRSSRTTRPGRCSRPCSASPPRRSPFHTFPQVFLAERQIGAGRVVDLGFRPWSSSRWRTAASIPPGAPAARSPPVRCGGRPTASRRPGRTSRLKPGNPSDRATVVFDLAAKDADPDGFRDLRFRYRVDRGSWHWAVGNSFVLYHLAQGSVHTVVRPGGRLGREHRRARRPLHVPRQPRARSADRVAAGRRHTTASRRCDTVSVELTGRSCIRVAAFAACCAVSAAAAAPLALAARARPARPRWSRCAGSAVPATSRRHAVGALASGASRAGRGRVQAPKRVPAAAPGAARERPARAGRGPHPQPVRPRPGPRPQRARVPGRARPDGHRPHRHDPDGGGHGGAPPSTPSGSRCASSAARRDATFHAPAGAIRLPAADRRARCRPSAGSTPRCACGRRRAAPSCTGRRRRSPRAAPGRRPPSTRFGGYLPADLGGSQAYGQNSLIAAGRRRQRRADRHGRVLRLCPQRRDPLPQLLPGHHRHLRARTRSSAGRTRTRAARARSRSTWRWRWRPRPTPRCAHTSPPTTPTSPPRSSTRCARTGSTSSATAGAPASR